MPYRAARIILARWFGWTLDYVDSLDAWEIVEIVNVLAEYDGGRRSGKAE